MFFCSVSIPQNCSWSWRKLLKLRSIAEQFLSFKVGDGRKIFLWYDVWHPEGYLFDIYGYQMIYDAGSAIGPKVSSIIQEGAWYWPSARSDNLVHVQSIKNKEEKTERGKKKRRTQSKSNDYILSEFITFFSYKMNNIYRDVKGTISHKT
jgi:hypothetical protein